MSFIPIAVYSTTSYDGWPNGIIFTGRSLVIYGQNNKSIYFVDLEGNLIRTVVLSGSVTTGRFLEFDGKYLYLISTGPLRVLKYDLDGNLINSFDISAIVTSHAGLAYDGRYFWIPDLGTTLLRMFDNQFNNIKSFTLPDTSSLSQGLSFTGSYFLSSGENGWYIYNLTREGTPVKQNEVWPDGLLADDLAFDGKHFWYIRNSGDKLGKFSL